MAGSTAIDLAGVSGMPWAPLGPDVGITSGASVEEDDTGIGVEHFLKPLRMGDEPRANARHRRLLGGELSLLHEVATDGPKGLSILIRILQPNDFAIRQLHAPGALDLEQEGIERTVYPHDLLALKARVGGKFGPRVVRQHPVALSLPRTVLPLSSG